MVPCSVVEGSPFAAVECFVGWVDYWLVELYVDTADHVDHFDEGVHVDEDKLVHLVSAYEREGTFQFFHAVEEVDAVDFAVVVVQVTRDADEGDGVVFRVDVRENHGVHQASVLPGNQNIRLPFDRLSLISVVWNGLWQN